MKIKELLLVCLLFFATDSFAQKLSSSKYNEWNSYFSSENIEKREPLEITRATKFLFKELNAEKNTLFPIAYKKIDDESDFYIVREQMPKLTADELSDNLNRRDYYLVFKNRRLQNDLNNPKSILAYSDVIYENEKLKSQEYNFQAPFLQINNFKLDKSRPYCSSVLIEMVTTANYNIDTDGSLRHVPCHKDEWFISSPYFNDNYLSQIIERMDPYPAESNPYLMKFINYDSELPLTQQGDFYTLGFFLKKEEGKLTPYFFAKDMFGQVVDTCSLYDLTTEVIYDVDLEACRNIPLMIKYNENKMAIAVLTNDGRFLRQAQVKAILFELEKRLNDKDELDKKD